MNSPNKKISPCGPIRFRSIDEYHASFPADIQRILQQLRQTIKKVAPQFPEVISYNIPTFENLISYAGYKKHIGLYPGSRALEVFKNELKEFKTSKGAVQLPLDKPLPIPLIREIVKFRVDAQQEKTNTKKNKKMETKEKSLSKDIQAYNDSQANEDRKICNILAQEISRHLSDAEDKIWHAHPVWFLEGNPIVGYSKLKDSVRLMFWSGQSFDEKGLQKEGSFKAAEIRYTTSDMVDTKDLGRWLKKSRDIQWDYKNIVKRKGVLERLK